MAAQSRSSSTSTTTTTGPETTPAAPATEVGQARGNDAAQDKLPVGGDAGLANYEAALGEFLGEKLYKAVSGLLTLEKVQGYGKQAVEGAISAAVDAAGGWEKIQSDPAALDALTTILQAELVPIAERWLAGEEGKALQQSLAGWVDAHPRTILLTALLAAAGAVLANADVPTLKTKFGIGGADAELEADVGKIRALALKKIRGKISYTSGPLMAAVEVTHENGETTGSASLVDGNRSVSLDGTVDGDGLKVAGVHGLIKGDARDIGVGVTKERGTDGVLGSLSLVRRDGSTTLTDDFTYNTASGVLSLGRTAMTLLDGGWQLSTSTRSATDGSSTLGLGVAATSGANSFSASYEHATNPYEVSTDDRLKLGFNYTRDDLKVMLDAALNRNSVTGTSGTIASSVEAGLGGNYVAGGHANATLGEGAYLEAGAFFGFRNKSEFESYLLTYRRDSRVDEQAFGVLVERKLSDVYLRFQQSYVQAASGDRLESSFQAGKPITDSLMLVGGLDYTKNLATDANKFVPGIGVQRDKVQVMFSYDPQEKAGMIKLGVAF